MIIVNAVTGDRPKPYFEFIGFLTSAADATSYTFSGASLGTPKPFRHILIGVFGPSTTVTVAGVTATKVFSTQSPDILIASLPTGTTGTIVFSGSVTESRCIAAVYAVYGLKSATPGDDEYFNGTRLSPRSIDVEDNGLIFGFATGAAPAWTGITEQSETTVETLTMSTAASVFASGGTKSVSCSTSSGAPIGTLASFR